MEQRQHPVDDVATRQMTLRALTLFEVGKQIAMRQHRRPRRSGRATREDEDGEMVRVDLHPWHGLGSQQLVEGEHIAVAVVGDRFCGDHGGHGRHASAIHVRPRRRTELFDHHDLGADRLDLTFQFRRRAQRVQRNRYGTEADRCQIRDHEVATVAAQDCHPIAVPHTEPGQPTTQAIDLVAKLAIGRLPPARDESDRVGWMFVDDAGQIHVLARVALGHRSETVVSREGPSPKPANDRAIVSEPNQRDHARDQDGGEE